MTARLRFPPYVRWVLGEDIQVLCQEGRQAEAITPLQAIKLATDLLVAARTVLDEGARDVPIMVDWSFIETLEGFETIGYVPKDGGGKVLGKSGCTVGGGVDLGQWSEAQLRQRRVPDAIIEQVRPYLGVRGQDAVEILRHKPLNMSREDASTLTECIRSDILDDLVRRYDAASDVPFRYLDQQAQTVIASVAFQLGANLAKSAPRFWAQVTSRNWCAAYDNLLNFGCKYPTRRRKEARLLKDLCNR